MRLIAFILSSAVSLTTIPACASAANNRFGQVSAASTTCPVYEGYPDCHPDGRAQSTLYSSGWRPNR